MKFKSTVGAVTIALDRASQAVDRNKKGETGGSAGVLVEANDKAQASYWYGTNLTAEVNDKVTCEVEEAGKSLIAPDLLRAGLLGRDPADEIEFALVASSKGKTETSRLRVRIAQNKKGEFFLPYSPKDTEVMSKRMRNIPAKQPPVCAVTGSAMAHFVKCARFCIPRDTGEGVNRLEMGGMRLIVSDSCYEAHATDGYVCALVRVKREAGSDQAVSVTIPQLSLLPMSKLMRKEADVKVIQGAPGANGRSTSLYFQIGASTFFGTRTLDGPFPNVPAVIKGHAAQYWLKIDRELLKITLQRAGAFDSLRHAHLEINQNRLIVRAMNDAQVETLSEELTIENIDLPEDVVITRSINLDHLLNVASTSTQHQLKLGVNQNPKLALMVEDSDDEVETVYAIMPVQRAAAKDAATKKAA